jgi:stalled ribosome rescue protein Dom34
MTGSAGYAYAPGSPQSDPSPIRAYGKYVFGCNNVRLSIALPITYIARAEARIMPDHYHAVVWIDHHEARIFHIDASGSDLERVNSSNPHQHLHHKANSGDSGHAAIDTHFLSHVADSLASAGSILITGPASAKTELASYIQHKRPDLAKRISGVETVDHPTDGQIVALARSFFKKDDRMHAQF